MCHPSGLQCVLKYDGVPERADCIQLCPFLFLHLLMTSARWLEILLIHNSLSSGCIVFLILATSRPIVVFPVSHQLAAKDELVEHV